MICAGAMPSVTDPAFVAVHAGAASRRQESSAEIALRSPLELDEATMRAMVAGAVDRIVAHVEGLSASPVTRAARSDLSRANLPPLPRDGTSFEAILDQLFDEIIPPSVNTAGPGYLAYIPGGGIFHAALADFIAKSVNRYVGYWYMAPAIARLESTVIRWFCDIVGYGPDAGGVLTSGGSMATLTAIIAARTTRLPEDFRNGVVYATSQTHYSVAKAALLAGFPERCLRLVPVDATWRMDPRALEAAIAADRAAGLTPFMVVGTSGTTNTGAVDPLAALADIAEREDLWLHVDGAYGGFFMLTEAGRAALAGISRADSVTLDPHKGLCLPYGTGALVTKSLAPLKATYGARAEYLPAMNDVEGEIDFCGLSPELSRDWRGLRVWLPLTMHGIAPFRENLEEKLALAREAEEALRAMPHVEILARPQLSVLAFRLDPGDRRAEAVDALNERWLEAITRRQRILLSPTRLDGRFALRMAILSFRTHADRVREGLADIRAAAEEVFAREAEEADEDATITGLFERQARLAPDRVALVAGGRPLAIGELDAAANRVAAALRTRGLREGGHVGVHVTRSAEAVIAILGVLKAGGVYVPIDPNDPVDRQRFIVDDAGLELVVCADRPSEASALVDPSRVVAVNDVVVAPASPEPRLSTRALSDEASGDRVIYVLYTSGSTGRPKGVLGLERATVNRLRWMWREFPFAQDEVYLHRTTLGFVDAVWEIFGPLLQGIPLVVLDPARTGDPDAIAAAVRRHRVSRLTAVPSILDPLVKRARGTDALASLRVVISSGERLQAPLLARVRATLPRATIVNLYGSTEVAGDVTCASFAPGAGAPETDVPIGAAITNARLFVLDEHQMPVPSDTEGELYVGGPVIARGYHRRPDEDAARFVALPHLVDGPLFRTGDRVRRDREGVLHYVGRADRQVKVRGVRIELDEVEAALLAVVGPGAAGAVVARQRLSSAGDMDPSLHVAAFVAGRSLDGGAIREALAKRLPATMAPSTIVVLDALPLLSNGKTDRRALETLAMPAVPSVSSIGGAEGGSPARTALEELILTLFTQRLPAPPTTVASDFHALGGDSLDLVEVLSEIGAATGRSLGIDDAPRPLTAASLARALDECGSGVSGRGADGGAERAGAFDVVPLGRAHHEAVFALLVESFSGREPMAAALRARPDDLVPFARALMARCATEPFSYVALARGTKRVVGFCFAHDFAGPSLAFEPARESPAVVPLFALLGRLHARYVAHASPRPGEVLELAATGASSDVDGHAVARALEARALADGAARGFQRAVSLCTNAVTRYLALGEQRMRLVDAIDYATFEYEGRRVFADAARHRGVALVEGDLLVLGARRPRQCSLPR